ncbi:hypothetical protein CPB86DRAFT_549472 [Serendipita vermifera]|nr:hypothetical protein CPB86DRAFT_549472 [Serendipita vermifera]
MKFTYAFVALLTLTSAAFAAPIAGNVEHSDVDIHGQSHHLHHYATHAPRATPPEDARATLRQLALDAAARRKAQKAKNRKVAVRKVDLEAALDKFDEAADDLRVLLGKPRQHKKKSKSKSKVYKKKMY